MCKALFLEGDDVDNLNIDDVKETVTTVFVLVAPPCTGPLVDVDATFTAFYFLIALNLPPGNTRTAYFSDEARSREAAHQG